jgi:hypothetical protein
MFASKVSPKTRAHGLNNYISLLVSGSFGQITQQLCAADFSLLNLPKGKSLGRSKPATNS